MTRDRIKDLANKGLITLVGELEKMAEMTENELIEKGYITHT